MYVMIGDMVNSRKKENRYEIQEAFQRCLQEINQRYQKSIVSQFSITLGDEFQGVLKDAEFLFEIITRIEITMKNVGFRFSVGIGEISTKLYLNTPLMSDGPAWYAARDGLNYIHAKNKRGIYGRSNIVLTGDVQPQLLQLMNHSIVLCQRMKERWTNSQTEIFQAMVLQYGLTVNFIQSSVVEELKARFPELTESDFNRKLKSSGYIDYVNALKSITSVLLTQGGLGHDELVVDSTHLPRSR